jgi:uncharacterized membrane protein YuzA (DUF378 family)
MLRRSINDIYFKCISLAAAHDYGAAPHAIAMIYAAVCAIKKVRINLRKCKGRFMKLIHVISLLLIVIGGLQFALTAIGMDIMGTLFGSINMNIVNLLVGIAIIHHVLPSVKAVIGAK